MAKNVNRIREGSNTVKVILIVILVISAFLSIYPFLYMLIVSFMETDTMKLTIDRILTANYTLDNYRRLLKQSDFPTYFKNSVIVTVLAVSLNCMVSAMSAYAFAKKKFAGHKFVYILYLITMMIPGQVTLIPTFLILKEMGLLNTYAAMVLPTVGAFGTILIHKFMNNVPDELLEAADIDGCGEIRKFLTIVVPLIKPVIISLAIFTFISVWGSLLLPLIVTTETDMTTMTVAIANLKTEHTRTEYGYMMACSVLSFLPPFVLYMFLQKQFVEGIALSGTKG